jgi:hypothetical protein
VSGRHGIQKARVPLLADGCFSDIATEKPVETTSDDYVGRPVAMERWGSVLAIKGPGQLAEEVL